MLSVFTPLQVKQAPTVYQSNAEALLSFSVIIFKNAVVRDFRYIVSSALLLAIYLDYRLTSPQVETHHMALCRTGLVLVYYPRDGIARLHLYCSTLQSGSNAFWMEAGQLVNTTALPDYN